MSLFIILQQSYYLNLHFTIAKYSYNLIGQNRFRNVVIVLMLKAVECSNYNGCLDYGLRISLMSY